MRQGEASRTSDAFRAKDALEKGVGRTAQKRRASVSDALATTASRGPEKYVKHVTNEELVSLLKEVRVSLHYSL